MPHLGTAAYETRVSMGMRALDNISAVLAGSEPTDRVV
jgi:lactate dehydrogenase-like 2-hydroxyacid dehydrogenase